MKTAVERLAEAIGYPEAAILWQDVPASASDERLRLFFEVFTASCDWWAERVKEALTPEPVFPEMVIMP